MTRYGIEVAQDQDTEEAAPKDLIYGSDYQSPKLNKVFKGTFTTDASSAVLLEIPHGLLYAPMVLAYYKPENGAWTALDNDGLGLLTSRTKVTIRTDTGLGKTVILAASTTYYYKFWVFKDPAELLS